MTDRQTPRPSSPDLYIQAPLSRAEASCLSATLLSSKVTGKHPFLTVLRKSENMNGVGEEAGLEATLYAHPWVSLVLGGLFSLSSVSKRTSEYARFS